MADAIDFTTKTRRARRFTKDRLSPFKRFKVLNALGPDIQWVQSYVAGDKIYCVYIAPDEAIIREHARCGGFPANVVTEVRAVIDPTTAETHAMA